MTGEDPTLYKEHHCLERKYSPYEEPWDKAFCVKKEAERDVEIGMDFNVIAGTWHVLSMCQVTRLTVQ